MTDLLLMVLVGAIGDLIHATEAWLRRMIER
jgi:hypothetical protein